MLFRGCAQGGPYCVGEPVISVFDTIVSIPPALGLPRLWPNWQSERRNATAFPTQGPKGGTMFKQNAKNRGIATVAVVAGLVLAGGGLAFAYWTSTGTGSGEATTGESVAFTIDVDPATGGPLTPGGPTQTVAFTVNNPSTGTLDLSDVTVTVANADGSAWTAVAGCSAADYDVDAPTIVYGPIAGGGDVDGTVTITMINTDSDQDGCQNADVPLYFVAS